MKFEQKLYVFFVGTYGTSAGSAAQFANRIMSQKGLTFDAYFDVKMPDTWTPLFDLSNKEKVADKIKKLMKKLKN